VSNTTTFTPSWQGIHHIALSTPNLDDTITFYRDILGMKFLFIAPASDMHGRHAAFLPGEGYLGLHFFEVQDAQIFTPPNLDTMHWLPGALHHIALAIPDEEAALKLRQHLAAHNVQMTEIMEQGPTRNMIFLDNNGIVLEANWPKA
jgi:catechol 2,3-dioxygenase-like lactoylglutathione lyase family enzyme